MRRNPCALRVSPIGGIAAAAIAALTSWTTPSVFRPGPENSHSHVLFSPKTLGVNRIAPAGTPSVGGTNNRWAGYVVAGQAYGTMSGSWTVPVVSYAQRPGNPSDEYSSAWIGIGGNAENDGTLVQLGTAQEASSSTGVPRYYAWYLFYGGIGQGEVKLDPTQYPVGPGDKITASIQCVASCTPNPNGQTWTLTMTSSLWPHPWVSDKITYNSSMSSAEWIMEATTVGGIIQQMPKFAPITFTGLSADGASPTLSFAENGLTIADGNNSALAIPTPPAENSFTVNEVGIPPSQPLPTQPVHSVCNSGSDYGQLITGHGVTPTGSLRSFGQVDYYRRNPLSTATR